MVQFIMNELKKNVEHYTSTSYYWLTINVEINLLFFCTFNSARGSYEFSSIHPPILPSTHPSCFFFQDWAISYNFLDEVMVQ